MNYTMTFVCNDYIGRMCRQRYKEAEVRGLCGRGTVCFVGSWCGPVDHRSPDCRGIEHEHIESHNFNAEISTNNVESAAHGCDLLKICCIGVDQSYQSYQSYQPNTQFVI